ncbi:hypothetical protein HPB51_025569 [Rhipicephalus microplus]|uniref:HTH psq-type domain-containing protein n=1 Tax=Rhipicephalus microplus TaxID=6941 RepID=A0A9J6DRT6_RHIMP|nr:hypothetical protein HPB51_025569 [Rhipicephalus microplus]
MASLKHKALSLEKKPDIPKAIDKQPARKRVDIAKDLRVPRSTLNSIVSKHSKIEGNAILFNLKAKQARGEEHGNLDDALLTSFKQARAAGINSDSCTLHKKVTKIANRLGIADFAESNSRIDIFTRGTASLTKQ